MRKKWLILTYIVLFMFLTSTALFAAPQQKNGYVEAANTYGAVAAAKVTSLSGNQNGLTITVTIDGTVVAETYQTIPNNASGEYTVGDYKVYVSTSGNTKVDSCFITYAKAPSELGLLRVVNPRPSRAPIEAVGLAPRLATVEGKTVAVIANYNNTMPPIARALLDVVKNGTVIFISDMEVAAGQSPRPVELEAPIVNMSLRDFEANPAIADAIVFGNGF